MDNEKGILRDNDVELRGFLSTVKGESFDICAASFKIIMNSENPESTFRYFLEMGVAIESNESVEVEAYFTASSLQRLTHSCEDLVDGVLNKLTSANYTEDDFYSRLWSAILNDDIFSTEEEKIYALYSIYSDRRIPYYQLESGIKMLNENFAAITESIFEDIKKAIYILNTRFEQRTEEASLLMNLLNSHASIEEQTVLLANILSIAKKSSIPSKILARKLLVSKHGF